MIKRKLDTEPGKIAGTRLSLGGKDWLLPPLNLESIEAYEDKIEAINTGKPMKLSEQLKLVCEITLAAAQRNYPEMSIDFLRKNIDLGNMMTVFQAIMGQSGYDEVPVEDRAGEPVTGVSTGQTSTLG